MAISTSSASPGPVPEPFGTVLTALATPFHDDGTLDLDGARRLAAHVVDAGSTGVVVAGTTGESPVLTHDETLALFSAVTDAVGARATVLAGCGKNSTAATVELVGEASALGVDGILLVSPYYNRPSQKGLVEHFRACAGATDLPVLLYNIPSRTAVELSPPSILEIREAAPNVAGVKDAVGHLGKTSWLAAHAPDGFGIYAGDDMSALPMLAVGAVGVVSVAGHLVSAELSELVDRFPEDPVRSRAIHHRLLPLFEALFCDTNPVPLKAALRMTGLPGGPVRLPLVDADEACAATVAAALDTLDLQEAPR